MGWRGAFRVLAVTFIVNSCAHVPATVQTPAAAKQKEPNVSGFLRFVSNDGLGQICPVGQQIALTARHIATKDLPTGQVQRLPGFWGAPSGALGMAWSLDYDYRRDLAVMASDKPFPHVYDVAADAPAIGDKVWMSGYDYRPGRVPLAQRVLDTTIKNILAAHLVLELEDTTYSGFSGSCVLNQQSQVVGIFFATVGLEAGQAAGLAVGVWTGDGLAEVGWIPPKG